MKLSWKIVLVVLLIVAVTVSAASYTMIASAFQAELDSQVSAAADESQMLCLTLGALAAQAVGNGEGSLREILNSSFFQNYRMIVYRQDGSVLWQNREEAAGLAPGDVGEEGICYMISRLERGGSRYLETIQRLELKQETFYVDLLQEADQAFLRRDANLAVYHRVMLVSIGAGALAAVACAAVVTDPIRKLSRSTRSMADGQYARRVKVRSRDELGALAEDFNHMADALEMKIQELAAAAQRQRDFTASFAHELKTPLTSVIGYADTLRSRELSRRQQLEAANYIFTEGKRLEAHVLFPAGSVRPGAVGASDDLRAGPVVGPVGVGERGVSHGAKPGEAVRRGRGGDLYRGAESAENLTVQSAGQCPKGVRAGERGGAPGPGRARRRVYLPGGGPRPGHSPGGAGPGDGAVLYGGQVPRQGPGRGRIGAGAVPAHCRGPRNQAVFYKSGGSGHLRVVFPGRDGPVKRNAADRLDRRFGLAPTGKGASRCGLRRGGLRMICMERRDGR